MRGPTEPRWPDVSALLSSGRAQLPVVLVYELMLRFHVFSSQYLFSEKHEISDESRVFFFPKKNGPKIIFFHSITRKGRYVQFVQESVKNVFEEMYNDVELSGFYSKSPIDLFQSSK